MFRNLVGIYLDINLHITVLKPSELPTSTSVLVIIGMFKCSFMMPKNVV